MRHEEWTALGFTEQWRPIVNSVLFKQACGVILEELYQFRTPGNSVELNALQNQFKEGTYSALATLKALAEPPRTKQDLAKPWDHAARSEEKRELPVGPKRGDLIRE